MGGVEKNVIYALQYAQYSGKLYNTPKERPYFFLQYTPLHFEIVGLIGKYLNVKFDSPYDTVVLNRFCCLFFNLMEVILIFCFLHYYLKIELIINGITSLLVFQYFSNLGFSRPDSIYSLMYIMSVILTYILVNNENINKSKMINLILGISIILTLCIFSKQSGIILLPLVGLIILIKKGLKSALLFSLISSIFLISTYLYYHWLYGSTFYENIILGVQNGNSLTNFIMTFKMYFSKRPVFVIILPILFFLINNIKKNDRLFWNITLGGTFLFQSIFSLKNGSSFNYYMEVDIMILMILGIYFSELNTNLKYIWLIAVSILCFICLIKSYYSISFYKDNFTNGSGVYKNANKELVKKYVSDHIGPEKTIFCLGQDGLDNFLYKNSILSCKDIYVKSYALNILGSNQLIRNLNSGIADYVINPNSNPDFYFINQPFTSFEFCDSIGGYSIYKFLPNNSSK